MKDYVLEFVGTHADGHFDRDNEVAADGVGFNGKRQIMQFSFDTDFAPDGPENMAAGLRAKHTDDGIEVLLHDAETYLAWLEKTAKRVKAGLRSV